MLTLLRKKMKWATFWWMERRKVKEVEKGHGKIVLLLGWVGGYCSPLWSGLVYREEMENRPCSQREFTV